MSFVFSLDRTAAENAPYLIECAMMTTTLTMKVIITLRSDKKVMITLRSDKKVIITMRSDKNVMITLKSDKKRGGHHPIQDIYAVLKW